MLCLSKQDDFKNVNPLVPSNYRDIAIKCYKAMAANNFKVSLHLTSGGCSGGRWVFIIYTCLAF